MRKQGKFFIGLWLTFNLVGRFMAYLTFLNYSIKKCDRKAGQAMDPAEFSVRFFRFAHFSMNSRSRQGRAGVETLAFRTLHYFQLVRMSNGLLGK